MATASDYCEEDGFGTYLERTLQRDWKEFNKTLGNFPHSFQLEGVELLSQATYQKLLKSLEEDFKAGLSTPMEIARTQNLMGCFHFLLKNPREALSHIEEALTQSGEERNLVSLANRAAILWHMGQCDKAKEKVKALENLKKDCDFTYLTVKAKAELAFSYTRIGGRFLSKAATLFTEVIAEARDPEIWLWKFGLALTQRRALHLHRAPVLSDANQQPTLLAVLNTLQEVIDSCQCSNLKAKCYSEIACVLQSVRRGTQLQVDLENKANLRPLEACEKALKLDPDDCSVLWKCGRIFRHENDLDRSLQLLQKAVDQRPTSAEYHHLGLTLKALARRAKRPERGKGRGRGRGGSRNRSPHFRNDRNERGGHGRANSWERRGENKAGAGRGFMEGSRRGGRNWRCNASQRGLDTGCWQYSQQNRNADQTGRWNRREHGTNRSMFQFGSDSQLCAPRSQRSDRGRRNLTMEFLPEQDTVSVDRTAEDDSNTHGACAMNASVCGDMTDVKTCSQSYGEQVRNVGDDPGSAQLLLDFSQLSLDTNNKPPESKMLHQDKQTPDRKMPALSQAICNTNAEAASQHEIHHFRKLVKSPSIEADQFSCTDKFVQPAVDAFQKAIEISEGQNVRALYDLALMHKALGEYSEALRLLNIIQMLKDVGPFDRINAYEQEGLILKQLSFMADDSREKQRLNEEGESKLNTALRLCSRLCNKLPGLQHFIQHVWHAFPVLLRAAEESDRRTEDKLSEKARLFSLIKDTPHSNALLDEIENISPEEAKSPRCLKMRIENDVEQGHYEKALTFIEVLKMTAQRSAMDQFEDPQYIQKVYMKAGKAALLKENPKNAVEDASIHFSAAFADVYSNSQDETSSSDDADSIDQEYEDKEWDIMLLHEQSANSKASALTDIFEKVFGLRVSDMKEDCLPGALYLDSLFCVMKRSKLLVVLAGGQPLKAELRNLLSKAAKRSTTVALLTDGHHVPKAIKSMRDDWRQQHHMVCPEELLREDTNIAEGVHNMQGLLQAMCHIFSFLVNIPLI